MSRRLLILGSTGSIGTQALDVVARAEGELEVVGLSAESSSEALVAQARELGVRADRARRRRRCRARRGGVDGRRGARRRGGARAARRRVRGRPGPQRARRLRRPRPDRRRARRGDRPRARQQGVARRRRRARHAAVGGDRRADHPGRLRALGDPPAARRRARRHRRQARPDGLRRPVPRAQRGRAARRDGRAGARAPDVGDGRQDHDRLGDADEQGPGADRGAPPVRHAVRADRRRRAPAVDRPRPDPAVRRRDARAPRLPRHARADRLRAAPPRPRRAAGRAARPRRARRAHVRAAGHRHVRLPAARARGGGGRRHRAVHPQRRQRGRRARLPERPAALPRDRRGDRAHARAACPPAAIHAFQTLYAADRDARAAARRAGRAAGGRAR